MNPVRRTEILSVICQQLEPKLHSTKSGYGPIFRWILPTFGAVLAIAALFWLYQDLDLEQFLSAIAAAELVWLFVLAGTILLEQLTRGWKWRQVPVATISI